MSRALATEPLGVLKRPRAPAGQSNQFGYRIGVFATLISKLHCAVSDLCRAIAERHDAGILGIDATRLLIQPRHGPRERSHCAQSPPAR